MSRLAYDDELVVHAESGDWVAFPCEHATRSEALAEMESYTGEPFVSIRIRKDWLKIAPPEETPSDYDAWWIYCSKDDPDAVPFWVCH